ncbi:basic blue protein-like [Tasmannia lanceolata]|uniref:basic blue protein-like n=1 Tax=Tasmannia lanceolata TaxID=3420 RepID=UPI004062CC2B
MAMFCRGIVVVVVVIFVAVATKEALAKQHVVGGSQGWDASVDFSSWESSQTFRVGDQLVFKYTPGLHSVVELASEKEYTKCNIGNALNSMNGGTSTVKLNKTGYRYFTCGTLGHCQEGMKLKIKTLALNESGPSTSTSPASASSAPIVLFSSTSMLIAIAMFLVLLVMV